MGFAIFCALYFQATLNYPGGSQADYHAAGFSWQHNYWCNLMQEKSLNGQMNPARPVAITALGILCLSLAIFWIQFPHFTKLQSKFKRGIRICGAAAMGIGFLLFTPAPHDLIMGLAALSGLFATAGTIAGLHQNGWKSLQYFGCLNILLVLVNPILYYQSEWILYLPVVQKITFASFLTWICMINVKIYRILETRRNPSLKNMQA